MTAIRKNKLQPTQEKALNKLCSLLDEKALCENIEKIFINIGFNLTFNGTRFNSS